MGDAGQFEDAEDLIKLTKSFFGESGPIHLEPAMRGQQWGPITHSTQRERERDTDREIEKRDRERERGISRASESERERERTKNKTDVWTCVDVCRCVYIFMNPWTNNTRRHARIGHVPRYLWDRGIHEFVCITITCT